MLHTATIDSSKGNFFIGLLAISLKFVPKRQLVSLMLFRFDQSSAVIVPAYSLARIKVQAYRQRQRIVWN